MLMSIHHDLFDGLPEDEKETEWRGMPEFNQPDNGAARQIIVSFNTLADVDVFSKLLNQAITKKTKSIWFPAREKNNVVDLFYINEDDDRASNDIQE